MFSFSAANFSPRLAKAPFDDTRADIILRSSDNVDFRVYQIILSLISPVFADRFVAAQSAFRDQKKSAGDALPIVHLSEDSQTLDLALRHCYPTRSPELTGLRDARTLLEFARKYEVDALGPSLTHYLTGAIKNDPVGVCALATKYQYQVVSSAAARASLELPLSRLTSPELPSIAADKYQQLVRYHSSCSSAASAVTLQREWFPSGDKWLSAWPFDQGKDSTCCMVRDIVQDRPLSDSKPPSLRSRSAPRFLWSYLHRSALVLAHQPSAAAVTAEDFVLKDLDCLVCRNIRRTDMLEFSRIFGTEIKKVIEKVSGYSADFCWRCIDRGWLSLRVAGSLH